MNYSHHLGCFLPLRREWLGLTHHCSLLQAEPVRQETPRVKAGPGTLGWDVASYLVRLFKEALCLKALHMAVVQWVPEFTLPTWPFLYTVGTMKCVYTKCVLFPSEHVFFTYPKRFPRACLSQPPCAVMDSLYSRKMFSVMLLSGWRQSWRKPRRGHVFAAGQLLIDLWAFLILTLVLFFKRRISEQVQPQKEWPSGPDLQNSISQSQKWHQCRDQVHRQQLIRVCLSERDHSVSSTVSFLEDPSSSCPSSSSGSVGREKLPAPPLPVLHPSPQDMPAEITRACFLTMGFLFFNTCKILHKDSRRKFFDRSCRKTATPAVLSILCVGAVCWIFT